MGNSGDTGIQQVTQQRPGRAGKGEERGLELVEEFEEALAAHAGGGHVRADVCDGHLVRRTLNDEGPQDAELGHADMIALTVGNAEALTCQRHVMSLR